MAPIKAVLRSKLDKGDTAKSLMELVDKFDVFSDVSSAASCADYQEDVCGGGSESEVDALPTLFARPTPPVDRDAVAAAFQRHQQQGQLQLFLAQVYQQIQQQQQRHLEQAAFLPESTDEQPLNLTVNPLKRRPAISDEECLEPEVKRPCSIAAAAAAATPTSYRRRKRSYRMSDNDEIRSFQVSAPELFTWNGHKPMIHQFLLKLLNNQSCSGLIRWLDKDNRLFKVLQPGSVARLWQFIKGNRTDNYECFARGIRHSRDIGKYFEAHEYRKKKVYKFSEKAMRNDHVTGSREPRQHQQPLPHQQEALGQSASTKGCNDVLEKLKVALAERQQQQQHLAKAKCEPTSVEENELDNSDLPLVIADV